MLQRFLPWHPPQPHGGYQQGGFLALSPAQRSAFTREVVLSLSLARYADYLVCTLSSNVARLAALLRFEQRLETVVSLDDPEWYIH